MPTDGAHYILCGLCRLATGIADFLAELIGMQAGADSNGASIKQAIETQPLEASQVTVCDLSEDLCA